MGWRRPKSRGAEVPGFSQHKSHPRPRYSQKLETGLSSRPQFRAFLPMSPSSFPRLPSRQRLNQLPPSYHKEIRDLGLLLFFFSSRRFQK